MFSLEAQITLRREEIYFIWRTLTMRILATMSGMIQLERPLKTKRGPRSRYESKYWFYVGELRLKEKAVSV
jgi:hypothetical protein